ncbi:hypothetical protein GGR50DRAFT_644090 [Xylaria sp. CBS 124048]|nr:hypothetical protein GGR50DRAFT_644090 [Xylaria sp. CBS 124048]
MKSTYLPTLLTYLHLAALHFVSRTKATRKCTCLGTVLRYVRNTLHVRCGCPRGQIDTVPTLTAMATWENNYGVLGVQVRSLTTNY